jgi:hypothetical protein
MPGVPDKEIDQTVMTVGIDHETGQKKAYNDDD